MQTSTDYAQDRHELEVILASGIFHRAPNLAQLLTYVCTKYFEGTAEQIKEYNIAVDALGRPPDFDQKRDSIVRVEAHRLRKRLREYYDADGADHALRIDIPPGQYAPRFVAQGMPEPSLSPENLRPENHSRESLNPESLNRLNGELQAAELHAVGSQADFRSGALAVPNGSVPDGNVPAVPDSVAVLPPAYPLADSRADTRADSRADSRGDPLLVGLVVAAEASSDAQVAAGASGQAGRRSRGPLIATVSLLMFCTGAIAVWNGPIRKTTGVAAGPIANLPPLATAHSREVRILAGHLGSEYTDRLGRIWQPDRYFQGGYVFETREHPILGTREPGIYQSRREGAFTYDIPLAAGVYELRLHFAETLFGENNVAGGGESSRIFNVQINGADALREFDVISEAGPSTADVRAFKDISPAADGKLHLKFEPFTGPPLLSAIEITPGTPGRLQPIRMIALDRAYTDKQGSVWEPDRYSRGGVLVLRTRPVEGAADPELFRGERYGNLRYVIPVPAGRYGVTIYFAEAWFGPGTPPGGGLGSRLFDIQANGVILRHGFDIFKEARGAERATSFSVHGLEPDAQGKLTIALIPTRNYACINAIEVLDESK